MRRFLSAIVLTGVLFSGLPSAENVSLAQAQRKTTAKAAPVSLASQRGVETINAAELKDYLSFIASDEMEGRDTPSRGLDTTAKFLAMNLSRWGFKPAGDDGSFFQKIGLRRDYLEKAETKVQLNGQTLIMGEDYIPYSRTANVSASLVFAGSGWFIKSKNIDAYKGMDAKGKIAVIVAPPDGLPRGITRTDLTGKRGEDYMTAGEYAQKQGVAALVFIPDFQYLANWDRNRSRLTERGVTRVEKFQNSSAALIAGNPAVNSVQLPQIVVAPRVANVLFQGEKQSANAIFDSIYSGKYPDSFELNPEKQLTLAIKTKSEALATQNVVAVFEGSDPVLKDEYVAVGAHYDHIGIGVPVNGDAIYNGADDDGSGTTALLAMAEALAKAPKRPKRSVLFVWHAGEEKGLWGSRYFSENPTIPLNEIVTQLNIDMIGRSKKEGDANVRNANLSGPNEVYVIGSKMMSTELGELTETVNKDYLNLTFNYRYDDPTDPNRFFFRSDHYNYAKKGIPIVFFFDGEHEDYHRPGDEVQKIDFQKMEKITRTVYMLLWEVANRAVRPKVDKQLPVLLAGD
jgi:Zn-dependent M28 family amino/carboxypeptidase